MRHRHSRQSRCFGFVDFSYAHSASSAIIFLDSRRLLGPFRDRPLLVKPSSRALRMQAVRLSCRGEAGDSAGHGPVDGGELIGPGTGTGGFICMAPDVPNPQAARAVRGAAEEGATSASTVGAAAGQGLPTALGEQGKWTEAEAAAAAAGAGGTACGDGAGVLPPGEEVAAPSTP